VEFIPLEAEIVTDVEFIPLESKDVTDVTLSFQPSAKSRPQGTE